MVDLPSGLLTEKSGMFASSPTLGSSIWTVLTKMRAPTTAWARAELGATSVAAEMRARAAFWEGDMNVFIPV